VGPPRTEKVSFDNLNHIATSAGPQEKATQTVLGQAALLSELWAAS
jgi:hypothetical protein